MAAFDLDDAAAAAAAAHPGQRLHVLLFADVVNSAELVRSMQAGALELELAFLRASLVPGVFPVLVAAHKAVLARARGSLVTRTLHSELIYNYSGSKHITESLRRCGIADGTSYVLVARFNATSDELETVRKLVQGTEISLEELGNRADKSHIQKHYKLSSVELEISSLADAIACRIVARDAL